MAFSMASSALQFSWFRNCSNVCCISAITPSELHSLGVAGRTHLKCSTRFISHVGRFRIRDVRKQCIINAISPELVTHFQEAPQKGLKRGIMRKLTMELELYNDQVHLEKPLQYVICSTRESEEKVPEVADSRTDEEKKKTGENLNFEEDCEDDEDDFEYDWPPLVCCFGAVRNGFIPITRKADNQMGPEKGMQGSLPELVRMPGPPSNVATALVQLGGRAAVMGKVGKDRCGHQMVLALNLKRVQTRGVRFDPCVSTAISYMKLAHQDGKLALTCLKPCAEDSLVSSEINVDILKEARMFHFNSMVLLTKSMRSTLLAAVEISKKFDGVIFFDVDLSLPLWKSCDEMWRIIQEAWNGANVIKVSKEELDFLLDNDHFEKNSNSKPQCDAWSVSEMKIHIESYHYTREEISPLWHDNIKILFVTDGTFRIHYYTPKFDGSVTGIDDVLMTPFICDRSTWGDAVVAGIITKLTMEPELYNNQCHVEEALEYAIYSARESIDKKPEVKDNGSNEERKKIDEKQDKGREFEEDGEDDEDDFEYDWPPLVCCFGAAQNEFIPNIRLADKQMDPDLYSTWKGLQWRLPELVNARGPPSNVAIALVRLGGRAAFMGKVGHDPFGHQMVLTLNLNKVQTRGIRFDPCVSTAVSYMKLTRQDGKLMLTCLKPCAEDSLLSSEINVDILKEARMFHFNSMVLLAKSMRSTLLAAVEISKKFGGVIFFDVNLPLPLWRSRDETKRIIQEAWNGANVIEVTKEELEFLLEEDYFEERRYLKPQFHARSVAKTNNRLHNYHYTREEISALWHDSLKILLVTEGTSRIHYYTPTFDGSVTGTEYVFRTPFSCDKSAAGDAIVAGIIRKLTTEPEIYNDQVLLEKALRFAICSGIMAQWRIGGIRGFPTERTAENTKDQVYIPVTLSTGLN